MKSISRDTEHFMILDDINNTYTGTLLLQKHAKKSMMVCHDLRIMQLK